MPGFAPDKFTYENVAVDATHPPQISAVAADNGTVTIAPPSSLPGTATVTVTSEDGSTTSTYTLQLVPTSVSAIGGVGGTVPATLSLTLGAPASFGTFVPGVAADYTASTTANVISRPATRRSRSPIRRRWPPAIWSTARSRCRSRCRASGRSRRGTRPVSNDPVTITFKQSIGATDALRTGSYSKTLTFTLSTTTP